MSTHLNELVRQAKEGKRDALEYLVGAIQGMVYALAVRMLYNPFDAEDATQEILIKIITHLSDYKEQLPFKPWMFRIASNHLLNCRRSAWEKKRVSFDQFESEIASEDCRRWREQYPEHLRNLYVEEVKISCLLELIPKKILTR